ncbi:uncharacterized protein BDZ83DRAFT_645273 [Colletotrichum acutatum]|uniref:Uncharacterized protein n=1 Tax=Glomerella acutata TaxID=27357 RepID=A0AAD8X7R5_GLOAC|nr:uncharacterized protein BDZ83DRAFT_645273 [Colletotrichum acutatum]KAK1702554.1 hypothetical protein BDZ83DRAFT_645273 [Colletotrichum acutatum]
MLLLGWVILTILCRLCLTVITMSALSSSSFAPYLGLVLVNNISVSFRSLIIFSSQS